MPYTIDPPSSGYTVDPPSKPNAIAQAGEDFMAPIQAAGHEVAEDFRHPDRGSLINPLDSIPGHLAGALTSPLAGTLNVVRQPILRATTPPPVASDKAAKIKAEIDKATWMPGWLKDQVYQSAIKREGLDIGTALMALGPEAGAAADAAKLARAPAVSAPAAKELEVGRVLHKLKDAAGKTTDEIIADVKANPHRTPYHSLGDSATGHVKVLARTPGPGREIIRNAVEADKRGIRAKIVSNIGEGLGAKGDYLLTKDSMHQAQQAAAKNGMEKIGEHLVTLDENSVAGLRSDRARSAIEEAAKNALADPDPEVRSAGAALNRLHDQLLDKPSAITIRVRDAQDISRNLLKAGTSAYAKGDGGLGKALTSLGRAVRTNAATPERGGFSEYGEWLQRYGHDAENETALEMGKDATIKTGIEHNAEYIKRELGKMGSAASKDHYRKGLAEGLLHQVQTGGADALRKLLKNEDFQAKVRIAHPDDSSFNRFMEQATERAREVERTNSIIRGDAAETGAAKVDLDRDGFSGAKALKEVGGFLRHPIRSTGAKLTEMAGEHLSKAERSLLEDPETNALLSNAYTDPKELERLLRLSEPSTMRNVTPLKGISPAITAGTVAENLANPQKDAVRQGMDQQPSQ